MGVRDLVENVRRGVVRIPGFQRDFKWTAKQVEQLFDSIYQGFPIGTLFFWRREAPADVGAFGSLKIEVPRIEQALWVIDGQQRLTSLAGVLLNRGVSEGDDPKFRLYVDLREERFVRPRGQQVRPHWLPLSVVLDTGELLRWQYDNVREDEDLLARATEVASRIRDYQVPIYTVDTDDEATVREIFDRLNNFGTRLTMDEVFRSLHAGSGLTEPSDLGTLTANVSQSPFGPLQAKTVAYSVLAVRGGDITRDIHGEFKAGEDPGEWYRRTEDALLRVTDFLREDASIPYVSLLPTTLVVPILARFFALTPEPDEWTRILLRRWVWRANLTGVFTGNYVTAVRRAVPAIEGRGDRDALALLELPLPGWKPRLWDLDKPRLNAARTRIQLCMLARLGPRSLVTGEPLDVGELFARHGARALVALSEHDTLAARILHPPVDRPLLELAAQADEHTLASHLVDVVDIDDDLIEPPRTSDLRDWFDEQSDRLGEWDEVDRPSIASLVVADQVSA